MKRPNWLNSKTLNAIKQALGISAHSWKSHRPEFPHLAAFFVAAALLVHMCEKRKKIIESSLTFFDCETADIIAAGSDSTLFTISLSSLFALSRGAESGGTTTSQNGATLAFTSDRRETLPPIGRHVWADGLSEKCQSGPDLAAAAIESIYAGKKRGASSLP